MDNREKEEQRRNSRIVTRADLLQVLQSAKSNIPAARKGEVSDDVAISMSFELEVAQKYAAAINRLAADDTISPFAVARTANKAEKKRDASAQSVILISAQTPEKWDDIMAKLILKCRAKPANLDLSM